MRKSNLVLVVPVIAALAQAFAGQKGAPAAGVGSLPGAIGIGFIGLVVAAGLGTLIYAQNNCWDVYQVQIGSCRRNYILCLHQADTDGGR